jgi:hypothetical protein
MGEISMAGTKPHDMRQTERQGQLEDRQLAERWPELNDDDWTHLPIVRLGDNLEPGKAYFDLKHPERGTFKALGRQEATEDNRFVAEDELDPNIWKFFVGDQ